MKNTKEVLNEMIIEAMIKEGYNPNDYQEVTDVDLTEQEKADRDWLIAAMIRYGQHVVDECARVANTKVERTVDFNDFYYKNVVDTDTILEVKKNLK